MIQRILIFLAFLAIPAFLYAGDTITGTVKTVTGVDGFTLTDGTKIVLTGIAAPTSKAVTKQECVDHLSGLIEGQNVMVIRDSLVTDKTGKPLSRYVYVGTSLVNLDMIEDCYAVPSKTVHSMKASFAEALSTAKSNGQGAHSSERSTAVQCAGITQKGNRCKRMTNSLSGKCWQHE